MSLVVKLGGELLLPERAEELDHVADSLRVLAEHNPMLIVHGGGAQTSALQTALGQTPKIVGGRRVTDEAGLDALKMAVGGLANTDLVAALCRVGLRAVGINGVSARSILCVKRPASVVSGGGEAPVDYGYVGDVVRVDRTVLDTLMTSRFVPVVACIGADETGQIYNINADTVANELAKALSVTSLIMLTSAPGVLRDKDDPSTRWPRLTVAEARQAIEDGAIQGGMIPKLEDSFATLAAGVRRVLIVGHVGSGDIQEAIESPGRVGTVLVP